METQEGLGDVATNGAVARRELARGTVAIYKDYLGRGPTRAVARIDEDMVVILLQDSLTKAEVALREAERGQLVRRIRQEFQDAMRDELKALVERTLDREVICFMSDHSPSPDYAVEVLILGDANRG
jgi:uncharacterized protein YbcI